MLKPLAKKIEQSVLDWINVDRYLPLQIDITNACNLRCKHCYHPHHEPPREIRRLSCLSQAAPTGEA